MIQVMSRLRARLMTSRAPTRPRTRAGRAEGRAAGGRQEPDRDAAAERGQQVEDREAEPAEHVLEWRAELPEHEQVREDVEDLPVREGRREQPPRLALGQHRHHHQVVEDPRAADVHGDEDQHVERQHGVGDDLHVAPLDAASEVRVRGTDRAPSLKQLGHWKPTAALFMQDGQIGRSQRWQRTPAGRSGCR